METEPCRHEFDVAPIGELFHRTEAGNIQKVLPNSKRYLMGCKKCTYAETLSKTEVLKMGIRVKEV